MQALNLLKQAVVLYHEKDYEAAETAYDAGTKNAIGAYQRVQGISDDPAPTRDLLRHLEVYNHHASAIEAYHQGQTERALELYDLVLSLRDDDAEAYFNRGLAYRKAGDTDKALADYNAAIEQDPNLAKAYYERGNLEVQEGRYAVALADYFSAAKTWIFQD
jgi:tetratricopeptide (TPR) repeat protein